MPDSPLPTAVLTAALCPLLCVFLVILSAGSAPELLRLVFPGGSPVPGTAAPGAAVDSGPHTHFVSSLRGCGSVENADWW